MNKNKQTMKKLNQFYYCHKLLSNFDGLNTQRKWLFSLITVIKVPLVVMKSHNIIKSKFSGKTKIRTFFRIFFSLI